MCGKQILTIWAQKEIMEMEAMRVLEGFDVAFLHREGQKFVIELENAEKLSIFVGQLQRGEVTHFQAYDSESALQGLPKFRLGENLSENRSEGLHSIHDENSNQDEDFEELEIAEEMRKELPSEGKHEKLYVTEAENTIASPIMAEVQGQAALQCPSRLDEENTGRNEHDPDLPAQDEAADEELEFIAECTPTPSHQVKSIQYLQKGLNGETPTSLPQQPTHFWAMVLLTMAIALMIF